MSRPVKSRHPPRLAQYIVRVCLPTPYAEDLLEDLNEEFKERRLESSGRAQLWYWGQVLNFDLLRLRSEIGATRRRSRCLVGPGRVFPAMLTSIRQGIREARRAVQFEPAFVAIVVATLALGIGATTATFSVVNAVLLKPLPYPQSEQLAFLWVTTNDGGRDIHSGPEADELWRETTAFESVAQVKGIVNSIMEVNGRAERIRAVSVSPSYFDTYGVSALLGRTFVSTDEQLLPVDVIRDPDAVRPTGVLVLSYEFWQRKFGVDPKVIGRVIQLGGHSQQIIGVMPRGFTGHLPATFGVVSGIDVYYLSPWDARLFPRSTRFVRLVARLAEGVTIQEAQSQLDNFASRQRAQFPEQEKIGYGQLVEPLRITVGESAAQPLLVVFAAVGMVLLIACANVANLLLVRATHRARLDALCTALGAGRLRQCVQSLAQTLTYCVAGCLIGYALAVFALDLLVDLIPASIPRLNEIRLDPQVLLFSAAVTFSVAMVAGLVPALRRVQTSAATVIRSASPGSSRSPRQHLGRGLAITEIALAVVLVIGTGLLVRTLVHLSNVEVGFQSRNLQTAGLGMSSRDQPSDMGRIRFFQQLREALESDPRIEAAGVGTPLPMEGADSTTIGLLSSAGERQELRIDYRRVTPGFLEVLGPALLDGDLIEWRHLSDPDRLFAVIDARFAEVAFPGRRAVGLTFRMDRRQYAGADRVWDQAMEVEVVGVVNSIRGRSLRHDDRPTAYVTYPFNLAGDTRIVLRPAGSDTGVAGLVRETVAQLAPSATVFEQQGMDALIDSSMARLRFSIALIAGFAGAGLVLAAIGVFGVLAYLVSARRLEIGLRGALGASQESIGRLVLRQGLGLGTAGIGIGFALALALTKALDSQLYNVDRADPLTFCITAVALLVITALACWMPARRAVRIPPAMVLRG